MPTSPLKTPAGYVPQMAVAFANTAGDADIVSAANPIPTLTQPFTASAPLTGSLSVSGQVGPFQPKAGRAVIVALSGTWVGSCKLLRSVDGGATKLPVTANGLAYGIFAANACEPVWEESEASAVLYLDVTLTSGTLSYRLGQ
jgi:hypothetical protein